MMLATLLRYSDDRNGGIWDKKYQINSDFWELAEQFDVGMVAVMSEAAIDEMAKLCDGLLLPGTSVGTDPSYWGDPSFEVPLIKDEYAFDKKVIEAFVKVGKPIFGMCGGLQRLNIYFGGTLKRVPDLDLHRNGMERAHTVHIEKDSFVYDVFQSTQARVNSHHAWMIGRLAEDFHVVATAADGVIEAIECPGKRIYATQWHPELSLNQNAPEIEKSFFENFIRRCRECKANSIG